MEVPRHELPRSRRARPPRQKPRLLAAIEQVAERWRAAGRERINERHSDGSVTVDPAFLAEVHEELEAMAPGPPPAPDESGPTVVAVVAIKRLVEDGRAVRCALVRWSDDTAGEALAWYEGAATIHEHELIGRTGRQLDRLLLMRLVATTR